MTPQPPPQEVRPNPQQETGLTTRTQMDVANDTESPRNTGAGWSMREKPRNQRVLVDYAAGRSTRWNSGKRTAALDVIGGQNERWRTTKERSSRTAQEASGGHHSGRAASNDSHPARRLARTGIIRKGRRVPSRRKAASRREIPMWILTDRQGAADWLDEHPPLGPQTTRTMRSLSRRCPTRTCPAVSPDQADPAISPDRHSDHFPHSSRRESDATEATHRSSFE